MMIETTNKEDIMEQTYWNNNGKHEVLNQLLHAMVPAQGEVANHKKNKALEKFRRASNCYYDLYNNGLCNRANEFRSVFGFSAVRMKTWDGWFRDACFVKTEQVMDQIIEAAAVEQGLALLTVETV
jgi:hypothetical protein